MTKQSAKHGGPVCVDWKAVFQSLEFIKAPEGWQRASQSGFLVADELVEVDLVRLRDVMDWLGATKPRNEVLRHCFSRLAEGDQYPLSFFYVLTPDGRPVHLLDRFQPSMEAVSALGLPGVTFQSEPVELLAWLSEACFRVWPGQSDIESSYDRAAVLRERRATGQAERLRLLNQTLADVDDEQAWWPSDDVLLTSLDRVALPVFVAYALWGYGVDTRDVIDIKASIVQAMPDVEPAVKGPPVIEPDGRRTPEKARVPEWTGERLYARQQEHKNAGLRNFTALTAKEAGLSIREVSRRIRDCVTSGDKQKRA